MEKQQDVQAEQTMLLSELKTGQQGMIQELQNGPFTGRLRDLGFAPGSIVECRQKAPFGGPVEFEVRGSRFCLRHHEIQNIYITSQAIN